MCKRNCFGTYLTMNALPDNAKTSFPYFTITVGHFL